MPEGGLCRLPEGGLCRLWRERWRLCRLLIRGLGRLLVGRLLVGRLLVGRLCRLLVGRLCRLLVGRLCRLLVCRLCLLVRRLGRSSLLGNFLTIRNGFEALVEISNLNLEPLNFLRVEPQSIWIGRSFQGSLVLLAFFFHALEPAERFLDPFV